MLANFAFFADIFVVFGTLCFVQEGLRNSKIVILRLCLLGTRLLAQVSNCTKDPVVNPEVWNMYCTRLSNFTGNANCVLVDSSYLLSWAFS